jgi:hypothetical protein
MNFYHLDGRKQKIATGMRGKWQISKANNYLFLRQSNHSLMKLTPISDKIKRIKFSFS